MKMTSFLAITNDTLNVGDISKLVCHEKCGAVSLFVGTTRDTFEDKEVRSLEYEAYESMAYKELEKLCSNLRTRWPDIVNIAVYHRLGLVPPKEASVVIAIATPHRQASLEAVAYAIDELKKNVPIWKKELYGNGESEWKANKEAFCFSKTKISSDMPIPKELVQISAEKSELKNRIACFLAKKREEIDQNNIIDYTITDMNDPPTEGCARVNSAGIVKQENSKGHLKVSRVKNPDGPQTRPKYLNALDKLMTNEQTAGAVGTKTLPNIEKPANINASDQQRIEAIEQHLFQSSYEHLPVNKRLKDIEDRLLRLESISPEYRHFMRDANFSAKILEKGNQSAIKQECEEEKSVEQRKVHSYTVNEIDNLMKEIQNCNNTDNCN